MKLSEIKTRKQFDDYADVWYQRSHKLRYIWQNPEETEQRREKAKRLWNVCYKKVMICVHISIKLNQHIHPNDLEKGGIIFKAE